MLTDFARIPLWCEVKKYDIVQLEPTSTDAVGLGTISKMLVHRTIDSASMYTPPREFDCWYDVDVTEFTRDERFTLKCYRSSIFEMQPAYGGPRLWLRQSSLEERSGFERILALFFPPCWPIIWLHNRLVSNQLLRRIQVGVERAQRSKDSLSELTERGYRRRRRRN
jgi:hypothetical protein